MKLLEVENLTVQYPGSTNPACKVSFQVESGELLGIAGASGAGKSTAMLSLMGILPEQVQITSEKLKQHGTKAMIFQDASASLNPLVRVGKQLTETILAHQRCTGKEARERAETLLDEVGIQNPGQRMKQYPFELSGGMKQRVAIAIALACNPDLIIADEMSMCDTELLAAFLAAIPSGTTVLLVGDYDQLPSVGPGQVLRDLAESAILPVFHLKETIRQKAGSTIIKNAIAMRRGEQLVQGADFQIHVVRDDDAILNVIRREGVRKDTQYMIPVKPGKAGGNAVNRLLQEMVTGHGPCVRVGNITFYENDRIIMNHNNYPCVFYLH